MNAKQRPLARVIPEDRLECTDYNHAWAPHTGGRKGRGWWQRQRCSRCRVKRYRELSNTGAVTKKWQYDYSENRGYLLKGGRLTEEERSQGRLHNLMATIGDDA